MAKQDDYATFVAMTEAAIQETRRDIARIETESKGIAERQEAHHEAFINFKINEWNEFKTDVKVKLAVYCFAGSIFGGIVTSIVTAVIINSLKQ